MNSLHRRSHAGIPAALACVGAALALVGCPAPQPKNFQPPPTAASIQEAGTSHVALVSVIPWSSVAGDLAPDYALKPADAVAMAVPATESIVNKLLDSFGVNLGVGLPQKSVTQTTSQQTTDGKTSTTGTKTVTAGTGTAPTPTVPSAPTQTASGLTPSAALTVTDPLLRYEAATTLYQEAKLLGKYVNFAVYQQGYAAYLVRLQIVLMPRRRNLALDAYTNVLFYPDLTGYQAFVGSKETRAPIYVVPIISMDDLESGTVQRVVESMRSASLSLQGIIGTVGVGAGVGRTSDTSGAVAGSDLNALLTVARATNNSIRIRMGAMYQGTTHYGMVPRSHYITVLLLVSKDLKRLDAVTNTSFVDAETGIALRSSRSGAEGRAQIAQVADNAIAGYGFTLNRSCPALLGETDERVRSLELVRILQLGNYRDVNACMTPAPVGAADYERLLRMYSALLAVEIESTAGKFEFDVPSS